MDSPQFSQELIDKLMAEANARGLRGATAITTALRAQLTFIKRGDRATVPDNRTRTYFAVGSVIYQGLRRTVPEVADVVGLDGVSVLAQGLGEWGAEMFPGFPAVPAASMAAQLPACRVNLTRKGECHFQTILAVDEKNVGRVWVDLFVFNDAAAAARRLAELPNAKVF